MGRQRGSLTSTDGISSPKKESDLETLVKELHPRIESVIQHPPKSKQDYHLKISNNNNSKSKNDNHPHMWLSLSKGLSRAAEPSQTLTFLNNEKIRKDEETKSSQSACFQKQTSLTERGKNLMCNKGQFLSQFLFHETTDDQHFPVDCCMSYRLNTQQSAYRTKHIVYKMVFRFNTLLTSLPS